MSWLRTMVGGLLLLAGVACDGGGETSGAGGATQGGPIAPGDFSRFDDLGWIDTHVHLQSHHLIDQMVSYQDRFGMERMVLHSPPRSTSALDGSRPNLDAEALLAKVRYPKRFYFFGGLDLAPLLAGQDPDFAGQVQALADAGADGLKMYFKSTVVEALKSKLGVDYLPDAAIFAGVWEAAEARQLPVLVHIDEPYFESGKNTVLAHPGVTWIVTHMAFAGTDVARLETILQASDRTYIDTGHFVHLGAFVPAGDAATQFFTKWNHRILQGTDLGSGCLDQGAAEDECPLESVAVTTAWNLRVMLETSQPVSFVSVYQPGKQVTVTGLDLPSDVLRPIYHDNVVALLGDPRPVDCAAAVARVTSLRAHTQSSTDQARLDEILAALNAECQ